MRNLKYGAVTMLALAAIVSSAAYGKNRAVASERETEATVVGTISAKDLPIKDYPKAVRINSGQASKAAVAAVGGQVLSVGLEKEDGYLVYAVEAIGADSGHYEINVDAGSGKILSQMKKNDRFASKENGEDGENENDETDDD